MKRVSESPNTQSVSSVDDSLLRRKMLTFSIPFLRIYISIVELQDNKMILQQLFNNMAIKRSKLTIICTIKITQQIAWIFLYH